MDHFAEEEKFVDLVDFKKKIVNRIPATVSDTYRSTLIKTIDYFIDTPDPVNCTLFWKVNAEYVSNVEPPSHFVIALCLASDSLALEGQALEFQKDFYAKNPDVAHHLNEWTVQGLINHHNKKILSGDITGDYVHNIDGTPWNPEAIVVSHPIHKRPASAVEDMVPGPSPKRGYLAQEATTSLPFFENKDTPRLNFLAKAQEVPKDLRPVLPLMPEVPRSPSIGDIMELPLPDRPISPNIFLNPIPGMKRDEERLDNGSLFNNPARFPNAPISGMTEDNEHLGNVSLYGNPANFPIANYHDPFSPAREPSTFLANDDYGYGNYGMAPTGYNPGGPPGFSNNQETPLPVGPSGGPSDNDNNPAAYTAPEAPMAIYSTPSAANLPTDAPILAPQAVAQDSAVHGNADQASAVQDSAAQASAGPHAPPINPWIAAEQASASRIARLTTLIAQKQAEAQDKMKHADALRTEHAALVSPFPLITDASRGAYVTSAEGDALRKFVMEAHDFEVRAQKFYSEAISAMFEASRLEKERYEESLDAGNKRVERMQTLVYKMAGFARDAQGLALGAQPGQVPRLPGGVKDVGDIVSRMAQLKQASEYLVQQIHLVEKDFRQYREYRQFMRQMQ
ncbi:uncharacterized protein N0V96_007638 [Colletotrichum fioriniae]|uniref:uncharacterized protein n=1 Tax=Colletotrichum fioriniae TaxID=710243 RepID=UPI00230020B6|nr:uncharacterized protein COL516b_007635 [Colletotrichum fioriniae]KAJ0301659.1 hypothetical protein COL516b_007635 [Colletotrichum fioriniae]KAJ3942144.1 hypothetical protein N0V96_007638 [Colletotrichum fioriniae]